MRALLLTLLVGSTAFADTITTKDGVRHEGRILDTTDSGYVFSFEDGVARLIRFEQVESVRREGGRPADAPLAPPSAPSVFVSRADAVQLLSDWHALKLQRDDNGLGFPITAVAVGSLGLLVGVSLLASYDAQYSVNSSARQSGYLAVAGGTALFVTGVIIGSIRIGRRMSIGHKMDDLAQQARAIGLALPND